MTPALISQITVLFALGSVAFLAARGASPAVRHILCVLTLGLSMLLPWLPQLLFIPEGGVFSSLSVTVANAGTDARGSLKWLSAVWLLGAGLVFVRFSLGILYFARLVRQSQMPVDSLPFSTPNVRLTDVSTPVVWGWWRPRVFLPLGAAEWSAERKEIAIRHELAHIQRLDNWSLLISLAARTVYWFHPLVWWLAARMEEQQELACDDRVLSTGVVRAEYASLLVDVARQLPAPHLTACAMTRNFGYLRTRIAHITANRPSPGPVRNHLALTLGIVLIFSAVLISPVRAGAEDKVYSIGGPVTSPQIISKVEPAYSDDARRDKISGSVLLALTISSEGIPENIVVVRSLLQSLDESAISAVSQWRFAPAQRKGKPVAVRANIEVNFRLQ